MDSNISKRFLVASEGFINDGKGVQIKECDFDSMLEAACWIKDNLLDKKYVGGQISLYDKQTAENFAVQLTIEGGENIFSFSQTITAHFGPDSVFLKAFRINIDLLNEKWVREEVISQQASLEKLEEAAISDLRVETK